MRRFGCFSFPFFLVLNMTIVDGIIEKTDRRLMSYAIYDNISNKKEQKRLGLYAWSTKSLYILMKAWASSVTITPRNAMDRAK